MDRKIERKTWTSKRIGGVIVVPIVLALLFMMVFSGGESAYRVSRERVTIGAVIYDDFQDIVTIQAAVEPLTTIQIDASEGGVVEEIFVEDGANVEKNEPLLRLSNTSLSLDFMNRETQIVEQINNLRSTRITLDQNKRQVQEQLVEIDYQLAEQRRQWKIDSALYHKEAIAESEYLASKANLKYLVQRKALMEERFATDEAYRKSQLFNIDQSVEMMERNLEAIRRNLENLVVKAPISGQLNSFDHEIGETKNRGENLGRVDVLDGYQLSAQVDQFYLNRVKMEQQAEVTISNQQYRLSVSKILPTVVNNQFEIHLQFNDTIPASIRRGQSLQVRLELSAKAKSLMVDRGAFYQSTGGKYVFVVNENGEAFQREVTLGSQNPNYIQVLDGLQEGEEIITSSYKAFGEVERIVLEN
ncbi:MAG: efflux RND transporter periplasmic adaptor subunit [Flavobacteriales bacterium]